MRREVHIESKEEFLQVHGSILLKQTKKYVVLSGPGQNELVINDCNANSDE